MAKIEGPNSVFRVRDYASKDSVAVRRLNDAEIPNVPLLEPEYLKRLADQAVYCRVAESGAGEVVGFLLALDETADYESLNFQWFKSRYARFTYIDRIVVAASTQGRGVGRLLYTDLASVASPILACEVNIRPPNPRSMRFHKEFGFVEVGTQDTEGGRKTVSLMTKSL
jgi:uncharacterized protein